jgi:hypothetical protein
MRKRSDNLGRLLTYCLIGGLILGLMIGIISAVQYEDSHHTGDIGTLLFIGGFGLLGGGILGLLLGMGLGSAIEDWNEPPKR